MRTIEREIVGAFIFSSDGKLLIGQSAAEAGGVYSGQWVIPGGGIEPGETELQAVCREVLEETNLDIRPYEIVMTENGAYGESEKTLKETGERVLVKMHFIDFEIHIPQPAYEIGESPSEELAKLQWVALTDVSGVQLAVPARNYLKKKGYTS